MDTMKLLLGATVVVLIGAFVWAWQTKDNGPAEELARYNAQVVELRKEEIARLKAEMTELRKDQDNRELQRNFQQLKATQPEVPTPASNAAEIEAMKARLDEKEAALAKAEEEKNKTKRDSKVSQDEEGLISQRDLEKGDKELRRARMISDALLIGRVKEYVEDAQFGGFITIDVIMPEQVQVGTILAIRRKTGILAQFKVSEVSREGGIANPIAGFGPVQPKAGDELILPPPF